MLDRLVPEQFQTVLPEELRPGVAGRGIYLSHPRAQERAAGVER